MTNDDKPYGPVRYKEIIKELYVIAKNCNTPYTELLDITPTEKNELLRLIAEENERTKAAIEEAKKKSSKSK